MADEPVEPVVVDPDDQSGPDDAETVVTDLKAIPPKKRKYTPKTKYTREEIFAKGRTIAVGGKPKGTPNKVTIEAKRLCLELLHDKKYLRGLRRRLRTGKCAPAVETMLFYYAFGKPKERVELGADKSLAQLIVETLGITATQEGDGESKKTTLGIDYKLIVATRPDE